MAEIVDLDDRSVYIEGQSTPYLSDTLNLFDRLVNACAGSVERNCLKSQLFDVVKRLLVACQHLAADTLNIKNKNVKSAFCRDLRILLSERACRRISRIFERLFLVILLLFNELQENPTGHIDLSPDFNLVKLPFKAQRN